MLRIVPLWIALLTCCAAASGETMRIGVLTDLSGGMASWGRQTRIGAEIAAEEIQSGGGSVKLFFGDNQLQAKSAVSEFQKLSAHDRIQALYSEFTPTTVAIISFITARRIPAIYAAAAVSPVAASPYFFKTYVDYVQGCRQLGRYWKSSGITSVGMLKANMEFAELCAQGLRQVFPKTIEAVYNPGEDPLVQILLLRQKGVQALINTSFEADQLNMLRVLENLKWRPMIGAPWNAVAEQTRAAFPDRLSSLTVFALPRLPLDFIAKIKERDPGNTMASVEAAGLAYLHIKQLYEAWLQCRPSGGECIVKALAKAKPDPVSGFLEWHDRIARFRIELRSWNSRQEETVVQR